MGSSFLDSIKRRWCVVSDFISGSDEALIENMDGVVLYDRPKSMREDDGSRWVLCWVRTCAPTVDREGGE